jgi:hypothetical protein
MFAVCFSSCCRNQLQNVGPSAQQEDPYESNEDNALISVGTSLTSEMTDGSHINATISSSVVNACKPRI